MYPAQSAAMQMGTIRQLRDHYSLPAELWDSFTAVAGNPGDDLRLLAGHWKELCYPMVIPFQQSKLPM